MRLRSSPAERLTSKRSLGEKRKPSLSRSTLLKPSIVNAQIYGDLKHYTVFLERQGRQVDVRFVPDPSPKPQNVTEPYVELGGSTIYGYEVHYIISLDRVKIEHYAR